MVGMRLFKKKTEDPFAELIGQDEAAGAAEGGGRRKDGTSLLRQITSHAEKEGVEYKSPFRSEEEMQRAKEVKRQKFPTSSATSGLVDVRAMGYSVVDESVKRARDIAIPAGLKSTEQEQAVRLTALETRERQLQYLKDSQQIVDMRDGVGAVGTVGTVVGKAEDEDEGNDEVDASREPSLAATVDAFEDAEAFVQDDEEEPVDLSREAKPAAAVRAFEEAEAIVQDDEEEPVDEDKEPSAAVAAEALAEAEAIAEGKVPEAFPLAEEEEAEPAVVREPEDEDQDEEPVDLSREAKPEAAVRAFEEAEAIVQDDEEEPVDLSREAKPEAAVRAFEEAEAIVQDDEEEPVDEDKEPSDEVAIEAFKEAEALATGQPPLTPPPDIDSAPRVPFEKVVGTVAAGAAGAGAGAVATGGLFALFRRSKKAPVAATTASGKQPPVATPEDPEYIVRTADGYVSKAVYDKLEYDESQHQAKIASLSKAETEKYDAKAKEYEEKLHALQAEIDEFDAQMEQFKQDHKEKMKLKQVEASQSLLEINVKHINTKSELYRETESFKQKTNEDKAGIMTKDEEIQSEIDELLALKVEVEKEQSEHQDHVDSLTTELDAKVSELNESLAKKDEINAEIQALQDKKAQLEQEIADHKDLHQDNVGKIESIDNKEYLPQINNINLEISALLSSLALVQQEISNQKVEFSNVTKKLEEDRAENERKLREEKEERERKEKERLEKQREEYERQAEEARLTHEQEVQRLKESHDEALKAATLQHEEAAKKLEEEQQKRELVERERTRLQGEKAIEQQERGNPEDKRLQAEHEDKLRRQAEASAAASMAAQNRKSFNSAPKTTPTRDSSLYDYETVEEIITVDSK